MKQAGTKRAIHVEERWRLALLLAIPLLVSLVMWLVAREGRLASDWVRHTLLVELSLERLLSDLGEAESSQRGYLLTGEEQYLNPYYAAVGEARQQLSRLETLTVDNSRQQITVARIKPLVDRRLNQIDQNLELYRAGDFEKKGKPALDRGKQIMDSVRLLASDVYSEEERLLHVREQALSAITMRFAWALGLGYGLIVVAVGWLYRNVRQYSLQSAKAEDRLSKLNAELDQRVQERTALLSAREELLKIFVKYVPAAVAMLDREMRYLQVSDRWCSDYSLDKGRIMGRSHYDVFPELPERWKAIHQRCLAGETLREEEDRWDQAAGAPIWLRWEVRPWGNKNGLPEGILIFAEDITGIKRSEELLQESEATTRALLDTAAQAILAVNSSGEIAIANRMAGEMFGYGPDELLGKPHEILVSENVRTRHRMLEAEFAAHPKTRPMGTGLDLLGVRKDGSEFPIEVSLSSVHSSRGQLVVSFVSDITRRKQAELALRDSEQQLRALAGSLLEAQEDERRRIALELHDDTTQRLAFLSIELGKLAGEIPGALEGVRARIREMQDQAQDASSEVRRLSHGLHPSVISDFGLSIALEEFCQEFEGAQGVHVEFGGLVDDSQLDTAGATCLYRIAQEGLRNAVTHGHASEIQVTLSLADGFMQLQVKDNGRGFTATSVPAKPGLGVVSMRERIRLVNGTLVVQSEPGKGTIITASVPLTGDSYASSSHSAR